MRTIVLASHGRLAAGMKDSAEMVTGPQDRLLTICAYTDACGDPREAFEELVEAMDANDELILVTDVLGGSVNNEASQLVGAPGVYVVTGMNLPLVLNLVIGTSVPAQELIDQTLAEIGAQVIQIKPSIASDEEDF